MRPLFRLRIQDASVSKPACLGYAAGDLARLRLAKRSPCGTPRRGLRARSDVRLPRRERDGNPATCADGYFDDGRAGFLGVSLTRLRWWSRYVPSLRGPTRNRAAGPISILSQKLRAHSSLVVGRPGAVPATVSGPTGLLVRGRRRRARSTGSRKVA